MGGVQRVVGGGWRVQNKGGATTQMLRYIYLLQLNVNFVCRLL